MKNEKYCLQIADLVEEYERISSLPEGPEEVEEYLGEVLVAIDNIIDCICDKIDFRKLDIN